MTPRQPVEGTETEKGHHPLLDDGPWSCFRFEPLGYIIRTSYIPSGTNVPVGTTLMTVVNPMTMSWLTVRLQPLIGFIGAARRVMTGPRPAQCEPLENHIGANPVKDIPLFCLWQQYKQNFFPHHRRRRTRAILSRPWPAPRKALGRRPAHHLPVPLLLAGLAGSGRRTGAWTALDRPAPRRDRP